MHLRASSKTLVTILLVSSNTASAALTIPGRVPQFDLSPTLTVFDHTVTSTILHKCGTETAIVERPIIMGHGPVRPPRTATVTEDATTVTTHACFPGKLTLMQGPTGTITEAPQPIQATPSVMTSRLSGRIEIPLYGACYGCGRRRFTA